MHSSHQTTVGRRSVSFVAICNLTLAFDVPTWMHPPERENLSSATIQA
jgi:hypothetical protein